MGSSKKKYTPNPEVKEVKDEPSVTSPSKQKKSTGCFSCVRKRKSKKNDSSIEDKLPEKPEKKDNENKEDSSKHIEDKSSKKAEKKNKKNKDDKHKDDESKEKAEKKGKKSKDDKHKDDKSKKKDGKVSTSQSKNKKLNKTENQSAETIALAESQHTPSKEIEEDQIVIKHAGQELQYSNYGHESYPHEESQIENLERSENGDPARRNSNPLPEENIRDTLTRRRREFFSNPSKSVIETVNKRNTYHENIDGKSDQPPIKKRIVSDITQYSEPYLDKDVGNGDADIKGDLGPDTKDICEDTSLNKEISGIPEKDWASLDSNQPCETDQRQWKPTGFSNPVGYCYLNCVIQILLSCEDFTEELLAYDKWDPSETNDDTKFIQGLFDLFRALKKMDKQGVESALDIVQFQIRDSSFGDDVYKCFMNILSRISDVLKDSTSKSTQSLPDVDKATSYFIRFQKKNPAFVFDNFYGQILFQTVCKICDHVANEAFQMIKALPVPVPVSDEPVNLKLCVDLFFKDTEINTDEKMTCNCDGGSLSLISVTKIIRCPKYLFIYLNRGACFEGGTKNNTEVTCKGNIELETILGESVPYKLISVIEHMGDIREGHFYCKCSYERDTWWLLSDTQVTKWEDTDEIVTKATIGFVFKKMDHND